MDFRKILFPVDFSDRCRAIAPFITAIANRNRASLTLANIVEIPLLWYGAPESAYVVEINIPKLIEDAENRLAVFADELFPVLHPRTVVKEGDAASCIVEIARVSEIDLIMIPTRGRGRFRAALLGSTTTKILHDAESAVWTVAHADTAVYSEHSEWRKIVCALDTVFDGLRMLQCARSLQSSYGASICLVHAVPLLPAGKPAYRLDADITAFLKDSARQTIEKMQKDAGTEFPVFIEAGGVSSVVATAAKREEADLVLIGRGALTHIGGRLRTHAYSIIRDAACPVLSVTPDVLISPKK